MLHILSDETWVSGDTRTPLMSADIWFDPATNSGRVEVQPADDSGLQAVTMIVADGSIIAVTFDEYSMEDSGVEDLTGCLGIDQSAVDFVWCGSFLGLISYSFGAAGNELFDGPATPLIEGEFQGLPALIAEMQDPGFPEMDPVRWYIDRTTHLPLGMVAHWSDDPDDTDTWTETVFTYVPDTADFDTDCLDPASLDVDGVHREPPAFGGDLTKVPVSLGESFGPVGNIPQLDVFQ
ncbi:MAG TPA: hypothetical protein VFV93_00925, partial [Thermomicrobiales bacterium]|nr:hypothetical protein [Thermomicrobiales bacterium]